MVRLGFIIALLALIGAGLSGFAAYRVHHQELAIENIALARGVDIHASLVQERLTERELLARVAAGLFRTPTVMQADMLKPLHHRRSMPSRPISSSRAGSRACSRVNSTPLPPISRRRVSLIRPSAISTTSRSMPASAASLSTC